MNNETEMWMSRCRWGKHYGLLTLMAILTLLVTFLLPQTDCLAFRNVKDGDGVPAFSLPDLSGSVHGLEEFSGKSKLILFFADNDRSKKVMEILEPLYQKYRGEGLAVVAIFSASDEGVARTMADEAKASFPVLVDKDRKTYGDWGIFVMPIMAFVDKKDKLAKEQPYVPLLEGILDVEAQVILGKMSREDADLSLRPEEAPEASAEEKEADKVYNLGLVLLERGMKDKAVEKFNEVLKIDPSYCEVRLQLGQIFLEEGNADKAREQFEYVLKCDPQSHAGKVGMGSVYAKQGDLDKAVEMLESSLMLNPRPELAHYELGKVYEQKGDLNMAIESYKKAIERLLEK